CDYKMAGLDGRQLFEKLRGRESTRHIPFLFMASRADIEERLRPLVDGVEDFIAKPFLVNDLVQSLEIGQKSCRLVVRKGEEQGELYFAGGQCRDAKIGAIQGDEAVFKAVLWTEGEFEID